MAIFNSHAAKALSQGDPTNPPSAIQIEGHFTVDNCFELWVGTNKSVTKLLKGPIRNEYAQTVVKGYDTKFDYIPGGYLYIIAWSDNKVKQGLIGQFSVGGGSAKLYTDDPAWRVYPTAMDFGVHGRSPQDVDINAFLMNDPVDSSAGPSKWQTPVIGQPNTGAGHPFQSEAQDIDREAHWIWHDSGNDPRVSTLPIPLLRTYPSPPYVPFTCPDPPGDPPPNLHDEFLIFAIPLDEILKKKLPSSPPSLFAEHLFDDNKFALTPVEQGALWSSSDAETNLDFLVVWMMNHATEMRFDANLFGRGIGVRVASGPKKSVTQDIVVSATDQEDNSTPNTDAPANAGIRYTDGRVYVHSDYEVIFAVEGFVSPLRATLKEEFTSGNRPISLAELQTYDAKLPKDSAGRTRYNPLLSAFRAMGQFEAMVDGIINHFAGFSSDAAAAGKISTLTTKLENLKLNAVGKIEISGMWWNIEVTYPSYRKIKDNQTFP